MADMKTELEELRKLEDMEAKMAFHSTSREPGVTPTLDIQDVETGGRELRLPEGSTLGGFVAGVGELVDRFGGAPTRQAIHKAITAPDEKSRTMEAIKGFASQFGRSTKTAPTGRDIAKEARGDKPPMEIGGKVTTDDAVGLLLDLGLDVSNIVPGKAIAGLAFGGAAKGLKTGSKVALKTADIATGTRIPSTVGKTWAETFKSGGEALKAGFGSQPVKTFEESKAIAKRLGIPEKELPAAVKFGDDSLMSLFERFEREGPLGQKLRDAYRSGAGKLEKGIGGEVTKFGVPKTLDEAGAHMQGAFDKGLSKYFDNMDVTHKKVIKEVPGLKVNPEAWEKLNKKLNGAEKWAVGQMKRGITDTDKAQAEQIFRAVQNIKESNGSYKQTYEALNQIGKVAFKAKNSLADVAPDTRKFRALYGELKDVLEKTVEKNIVGGPELVKDLKKNNRAITEMYRDKDAIGNIMGNPNIGAEKKFNQILGDTRKIKALKRFLGPEEMGQLKASFLENKIIQRGEDGAIKWLGLSARLRNAKRQGVVNTLFEPNEMAAMDDYVKLANRFGEKVLSTSGTGASNQFLEYIKTAASRTGKGLLLKPIQDVAALPSGAKQSMFAPALKTPKAYIKSPKARLKALQTYSVQRESGKRKMETQIMSDYHGVDLSKMPYAEVDKLIKKTKLMEETKGNKLKRLRKKDIETQLAKYEVK